MNIDFLVIEITRRCNMTCKHCLRGPAQDKDAQEYMIEYFLELNKIKEINSLTFTGGEPFLNPQGMKDIINIIINKKISINSFYMATNGTVYDSILTTPLGNLCKHINAQDDEFGFVIEVSKDQYHAKKPIDPFFCLIKAPTRHLNRLGLVLKEGRAVKLCNADRIPSDTYWEFIDGDLTQGEVYINCLGEICRSCDYSYRTQKIKSVGLCTKVKLIDIKGENIKHE